MATTEVADALVLLDCIEEANVYGVEVPGNFHCASSLCYFWHDSVHPKHLRGFQVPFIPVVVNYNRQCKHRLQPLHMILCQSVA